MRESREEGVYFIKRVKKLPDNGNANALYSIIGENFSKLYRWKPKGEYEIITLSGGTGSVASVTNANSAPVTNSIAVFEDGIGGSERIAETVTQLSLVGNVLNYTDEIGTIIPLDFSSILDQKTDTGGFTGTSQDIVDLVNASTGADLTAVQEFDSITLATAALGVNMYFRWSENNLDGVASPNATQLGITK